MPRLSLLYVDTEKFWRGGQEQLFSLMKGMKEAGHDVCLAAPATAPLKDRAAAIGIDTFAFRQRSEFSPLALWRMGRILRSRRFDVVHFNTPKSIIVGAAASWLIPVPVRISSRRVNFPLSSRFSALKYNLLQDGIVTVSDTIRGTLLSAGINPSLVTVIYEGVDLAWIDNLQPVEPLKQPAEVLVGMVAHLSQEKGHSILLRAAACLRERFPEARYLLVGNGELREQLESLTEQLGLRERVRFAGFRSDCEALMKQFDVCCLPSLSEGLSSAILAAMANSLPVVATRVGGIPELVISGQTGLLVEANDSEALAQALAELLSSADLRRLYGAEGRRRVEAHFTISRKLDETERFYSTLLHRKKIG